MWLYAHKYKYFGNPKEGTNLPELHLEMVIGWAMWMLGSEGPLQKQVLFIAEPFLQPNVV